MQWIDHNDLIARITPTTFHNAPIITYHFSGRVELSVCCVCVSLRVQTITFKRNDLWPRYLSCWFIWVKFDGQGHGHRWEEITGGKHLWLRMPITSGKKVGTAEKQA